MLVVPLNMHVGNKNEEVGVEGEQLITEEWK